MGRHTRACASPTPGRASAAAAEYTLVDVQKVPVSGDPSAAIVQRRGQEPVPEISL